MSYLIGVSGKARHGKDYLSNELHKILDGSKIYSLANALKCYCRVAGLMQVKDGRVLQTVGTDLYRSKDKNFWIKMLDFQIQEENPKIAIISDIRFPNEIEWIEHTGGINIRVLRYNIDNSPFFSDDRPKDHPSEIALDNYPFTYTLKAISGDFDIFKIYAEEFKKHLYSGSGEFNRLSS